MTVRRLRMVVRTMKSATGTLFPGRSARQHEFASGTEHARRYKLVSLIGFALFVAGVSAAHFAPADGYEVSIYWATPTLYWIGAGGALAVALTTLLYGHDTRFAPLAVLLGGMSIASFVALPIIRGYYSFGYGDPMTHLGQIRGLWGGWMNFSDPIYPGSYVFTIFVGQLGGIPTSRAMLYVLFAMAMTFVIFVPLAVYTIVPDRRALFVGLFSGFLLLPINNVSTSFVFHPYSMNALYSALVVYLLVGHVTRAFDDDRLPSFLSGSSLVLPVATSGLLLFHPQTTSDVIVIFGAIAGIQLFYRLFKSDHPLAGYRAIYGQFAFLMVIFVVWANMHEGASDTIQLLITSVSQWLFGTAETAQIAQQRGGSMETLGISIYEMFAKLFLVSAIYCALAGGAVLAHVLGLLDRGRSDDDASLGTLTYFLFAGLGLIPYVVVHTVGRADAYLFRHIGFGMVLVTILGAVGLYYLVTRFGRSVGSTLRGVLRPSFAAIAAAVIVLSLLSVYASPFIYLPGQHVSEYQMEGYQTAFEMQPDDRTLWFGGVRQSSNRYEEAMFAAPGSPWGGSPDAVSSGAVTNANLTDLQEHYRTHFEPIVRRDHYFVLSQKDYGTELVAYDSLRYNRTGLNSVAKQEATYRVYSNGKYRLFYVDTAGEPIINETFAEEAGTASEPAADDDPTAAGGSGSTTADDSATTTINSGEVTPATATPDATATPGSKSPDGTATAGGESTGTATTDGTDSESTDVPSVATPTGTSGGGTATATTGSATGTAATTESMTTAATTRTAVFGGSSTASSTETGTAASRVDAGFLKLPFWG